MENGLKDVTTPEDGEKSIPDPMSSDMAEKMKRGTASHKTADKGGRERENLGEHEMMSGLKVQPTCFAFDSES
jgi:hypothetical protein